ncbi:MAG: AMP-binding protein, partial [Planctomycetota bacterium]
MGLGLFDQLRHHAAARGGEAAIVTVGPTAERTPAIPGVTWRDLHARTFAAAARVDLAAADDAVVMLIGPNRPEVVPAFLGVIAAGRTVFPVDASLTATELRGVAERAGVSLIVADRGAWGKLGGLGAAVLDLD